MPGLAFEDDEEPGGHVTQHGWTPGDIGQHEAGEQPVINDGSKVFSQKLDHTTSDFSSSRPIFVSGDDSEKMLPIPIYLRCHVAVIPKDEADPILQLHIDQDQRRRLHSPPQTERDDDAANLGRLISSQTTLPRVSNIFWFGCCFLQIGKVRAFHNIGGLDIVSVTWENI